METRSSFGSELDAHLTDFPKSDIWRIMTDGWQHQFGPDHFRGEYYAGLMDGFKCINKHLQDTDVTAEFVEELYRSIYQHEKKSDGVVNNKSFRHQHAVQFELTYLQTGFVHTAGASPQGIPEFVDLLIDAPRINGKKCWFLKSKGFDDHPELDPEHPDFLTGGKIDRAKLIKFIEARLKLSATNSQYQVSVQTAVMTKEQVKQLVTDALAEFNKNIKKSDANKKLEIIRITQLLLVAHCFLDGNARTCIFLLANFLLLKHFKQMMFTMTPEHFAAFSRAQILAEMNFGIALFEEYKITAAKQYLTTVTDKELKQPDIVQTNLQKNISKTPEIAMAQINELYLQLKSGKFGLAVSELKGEAKRFFSPASKDCRLEILKMLQGLYYQAICCLVETAEKNRVDKDVKSTPDMRNYGRLLSREIVLAVIHKHSILEDVMPGYESFKQDVMAMVDKYPYPELDKYDEECHKHLASLVDCFALRY